MTLFVVVEIIIVVLFALAMMLYMGVHFIISDKEEEEKEKNKKDSVAENTVTDETVTSVTEADEKCEKPSKFVLSAGVVKDAIATIKRKKISWLFIVMLVLSAGAGFYDYFYLELAIMKCFINSVVFSLVIIMGYIDFKEHIIPNPLVLTGMGIWGIGAVIEVLFGKTPIKELLSFSFLGFAVCGGLLLVLAVILKSGLGMGDVKMFAMLGLLYGLGDTYSLLICTMIPMAVFALVLLARKKVDRKASLPMAPFTVLAFLIGILGGI